MSILVIILLVIAGLIALIFIIGLFSRKGYAISRSININAPTQEVFNYVKHLKNKDNYNTWAMEDPSKKTEFRGTDGTVGFVYAWKGNRKVGEGEQEIKNIIEGKRVDIEMRFIKPFAATSQSSFITASQGAGQTDLTLEMSGAMKYPLNIILLFMNTDKTMGKGVEKSLSELKKILEKN